MLPGCQKLLFAGILGTLAVAVTRTEAPAQPGVPGLQPAVANEDDGPEVLARGPVHEAYATTVEMPKAGEIAPKAPPDPIEELPPDQKPEGDNVQWIPGYWDWDDERTDFIWISGFWRVPPPNHVWVAGGWNKVADGYQWTSGFWQLTQPNQVQPELEYLPQPPAPIEVGPSVPAPDVTSVYVTGSWVWRDRYVWRPGFWVAHRPNWIWVPAHYRWTRLGYIFIDGYWDYPLDTRGVLFTPVYFPRRVFAPGYFYTPRYVVAQPLLFGALFYRRGYSSYYFGDYYAANYGRIGYQPWCAPALRGAIGVVPARGWHYDPLWSYYSVNHRQTPQWAASVSNLYVGRYDGSIARPPRTLVQQNQVIQKITNVNNVNNLTVVNNNIKVNNKDVTQHMMVAPLAANAKLQPASKPQPISQQVRQAEAKNAAEIRQVAVNRQKSEGDAMKARRAIPMPAAGAAPTRPQPIKMKLDVPKAAVQRSRIDDEKKQPPPAPVLSKVEPRPTPKIDPRPMPKFNRPVVPKIEPKQPVVPKVEPRRPVVPKVELPRPKVDPPKPMVPKVEAPKPQPRVDPPKAPVVQPRVNPPPRAPVVQPRVNPPKAPVVQPRVNPPKAPVVQPRVNPPPRAPVVQPRVDPPKAPVVQPRVNPPPRAPVVQPRVNPPPRAPVVQPRVNPPKAPVVQPRVNPPPRAPVVQPRVNPPKAPVVQPRVNPPRKAPVAPKGNPQKPRGRDSLKA